MKSKRVIHFISSLNRGGRERQLATIYKYSDKSNISTKVICFNRTPTSYIEEYGMSDDIIFLSSQNSFKRFFQIRRVVKETDANTVWSWGGIEATYGLLLSLTTKVKHVNGSIRHGIVLFNLHQVWRLIILHLSRNIVANSYAGLKANKLNRGIVLYNGIDSDFYNEPQKKSPSTRDEFGIGDATILITSIANLVPYKDYDTILKALSIIKSKGIAFRFIAIGEGSERNLIEKLLVELDLSDRVQLLGRRTDIKEILYASDIFIHSSRGEGCSNAILEAMAAGLPIIASNTGGTSEIVDNTIGRLFEFQNTEELCNAILELINNKQLRESLSANARRKASTDFTIDKMMSDYYNIIEEVAG